MSAPIASCMSSEQGCVAFNCLVHLWEWLDPPVSQDPLSMENKKTPPATQQPLTQQHMHHVHPGLHQHGPHITTYPTSPQPTQMQINGVTPQLVQNQYHSNLNPRSPLLENRHELYGTGYNQNCTRRYAPNDNYNYPISPTREQPRELQTDHNVNHELHNIPKGYNAEVYQDYLKRNPPRDTNQIYQNHQTLYRSNNQYGSKSFLPYSNRIGAHSNTELLRRQYNEIQQMKLQQQMHYQSQAQMQQQQTFAERQLLLQQIHGIQPPPNLQNSLYSDGSYSNLDRYSSRTDFKEQYTSPDLQKEADRYAKNNEMRDVDKQIRHYRDTQWQSNQQIDYRDDRYSSRQDQDKSKSQSPPSDYPSSNQRNNVGVVSPMKSSDSNSPSIKSPSSESRRSSGGNQALRSPIAQRAPSAPVTMAGLLYKQGSDGLKVWRKRWFVLSEYCLFYYKNQDEEKLLGSVLLPSYKVSACTAEDKVLRKYAFKLEHANMRTYILAAPDQESMLKWVKALTLASLMQTPSGEQTRKQEKTTATKIEELDDAPGPTYANAPPKPRRSNEGYNSPSPEMYDPNYDLLKTPASHYSQGTSHNRYQDPNYQSTNTENLYTISPQSPPAMQPYTKRSYDSHNLSLPLTNTLTDKLDNIQNAPGYRNNAQSSYFDRTRNQQRPQESQEPTYEHHIGSNNPFLQDISSEISPRDGEVSNRNFKPTLEHENVLVGNNEQRLNLGQGQQNYNKDVYVESNTKSLKPSSSSNDRLIDRRTPDAYGRSATTSSYKTKTSDYEDVYATYTENEYEHSYKTPTSPREKMNMPAYSENILNYTQNPSSHGPSVLRRKKMQANAVQLSVPRPHSADFLEYESKNELQNKTIPTPTVCEPVRQPQRPKSSLDIHSYYDPSSDRYYSEESYAEKMRQSAQYLQHDKLGPKNIQIPLAKYASGLAEKQLHSPYPQNTNNNYETEFSTLRINKEASNYTPKYDDVECINSNWTLKEKNLQAQKDYSNRSGSVMSDNSNACAFAKEAMPYDSNVSEGFMRSASARLPSTCEREGEKKVQQREESMKRLLEWKQRMLQSPLTRKSTPAAISLARSLNQSRQSLRSDQYRSKTYNNSYNNYSSDDEEKSSGTDLRKSREIQAGRSQRESLPSTAVTQITTPRETPPEAIAIQSVEKISKEDDTVNEIKENTYENTKYNNEAHSQTEVTDSNIERSNTNSVVEQDEEETHDSEAESETQMEYTDHDLDEVLETVHDTNEIKQNHEDTPTRKNKVIETEDCFSNEKSEPETPPVNSTEDHYLPMSPRKTSVVEPAHQIIIKNLSVFDQSLVPGVEDNPYVEMNLGNEEDDLQTYEVVCVNNGILEPVYMELSSLSSSEITKENQSTSNNITDSVSNFADTKDHTLKRVFKGDKSKDEKKSTTNDSVSKLSDKSCNKRNTRSDCSDVDDEGNKEIDLGTPFNRFSISDTFRPASYYLRGSRNISDTQGCSDSEIIFPPQLPRTSPNETLSDEALSKYVLEKLDKSNLSQDNSILKMLTTENQKMNSIKRKTTSLMIYSSRPSIHDTLSRGEKIRHSRASLSNEKFKAAESHTNLLCSSLLERHNSNHSIETDSLMSYSADRGSSRMSLESDISSKFEMVPSNLSSEVTSLNESDTALELRHPPGYRDIQMMIKRRPLSEDSFFELNTPETSPNDRPAVDVNLDSHLNNLKIESHVLKTDAFMDSATSSTSLREVPSAKDNLTRAVQLLPMSHTRSSSTPVVQTSRQDNSKLNHNPECTYRNISDQHSGYTGSQSSCSSVGVSKSPISYYCKNFNEQKTLVKNLNKDVLSNKIMEFEREKIVPKSGNDTNASSSTTGFHSRESSTEHSAPYYYSDLSSQEHINVLPTSHYLKNTNLHRKLNNQRRRGPLNKKNEITHIHNPIHSNQYNRHEPFELDATARSVSVEFLSAAEKDPEIDMKNIYESTSSKTSKIPESMSNLSAIGCKHNSSNNDSLCSDVNKCSPDTSHSSNTTQIESHANRSPISNETVLQTDLSRAVESHAYENLICQGDKLWDEDSLWRDKLRRVSHRHARSMDDLDTLPENSVSGRTSVDMCGMSSLKYKKKLSRNVTYVNCNVQVEILRKLEKLSHDPEPQERPDENDVYVSLVQNPLNEKSEEQSDEGVYEQLAVESLDNSNPRMVTCKVKGVRKFEIDREKLRQWDLMSSGLMKAGPGVGSGLARGAGAGGACSTDSGADSASNEASMTMSGANIESNNSSNINQQKLSKKSFVGSNTSIGRMSRDAIPVRAVSPRVRWVEDKTNHDNYSTQQLSASQQNLQFASEDAWSSVRSPSRASQQPIRAVSPRVRRELEDMFPRGQNQEQTDIPTAGELLGRTHEELVLLLIQLRRRHAATHRAMDQCCGQISAIEDCLGSLKGADREENLRRLEQLKRQLMELEQHYEKSKPLVQLVDNMVKLGSFYNRPGSTVERLERNQRLRQKILEEHAYEQSRWLEIAAAGRPLETEAARARVAELWALQQELADEAAMLHGLKTDKEAIDSLLTGVRDKFAPPQEGGARDLEAELTRVHAMLALNSKKLEQTVADNARLERELMQLRRALHAQRHSQQQPPPPAATLLEDEVSRVQQLVSALQRQRQELSRAVRQLTLQSRALQTTQPGPLASMKRRPTHTSWQETNLDTGHTVEHGQDDAALLSPGHYEPTVAMTTPLYVDTQTTDIISPLTSEDVAGTFGNLSNVEKQEIKTVRIVKRESERRQRDRDRSLQPAAEWSTNVDQFLEEELIQPTNYARSSSVPRTDFSKFEEYYSKPLETSYKLPSNEMTSSVELSPKFSSTPSLSNYDINRDISLNSSYPTYNNSLSLSTQYLNSPTESTRTLTNDPLSKTSSIGSLTRSHIELSPTFKSEAARQIITEMSDKTGSLHRRRVPKEKRRHYTAPHHLSSKTLNEIPKDSYNQDKLARSLDDADMERALRAPPDVVRSAIVPQRYAENTIDQLLAAPQKILIPERYIPEKPPELSPEEQQKRQEKVESIKKMLSTSSADPNKSPDGVERRQREHLLQMNQILAKQVMEMSKIVAVKALEEMPEQERNGDSEDRSPEVELPIYQQRDNFFS